jgi:hypothetical protein
MDRAVCSLTSNCGASPNAVAKSLLRRTIKPICRCVRRLKRRHAIPNRAKPTRIAERRLHHGKIQPGAGIHDGGQVVRSIGAYERRESSLEVFNDSLIVAATKARCRRRYAVQQPGRTRRAGSRGVKQNAVKDRRRVRNNRLPYNRLDRWP